MGLNRKTGIMIFGILLFALIVFAAEQNVYVHTNFHLKNLYNATNLSIVGTFTDGVLSIANGTITGLRTLTGYYNTTQVDAAIVTANTSLKSYVDTADTALNTSVKAYADAQDIVANTSVKNWFVSNVVGLVGNYTAGIVNYFNKTDILGFGYYNLSSFNIANYFTSAQVLAFGYFNLSTFNIANYYNKTQTDSAIVTANSSMKSYADAQDQIVNNSATEWNNTQNFPVGCPAGSFITNLSDAVTCTAQSYNTTANIFNAVDNGTFVKLSGNVTRDIPQYTGNVIVGDTDHIVICNVSGKATNVTLPLCNSTTIGREIIVISSYEETGTYFCNIYPLPTNVHVTTFTEDPIQIYGGGGAYLFCNQGPNSTVTGIWYRFA